LLIGFCCPAFGQDLTPRLSAKHMAKVEATSDPVRKLRLYKKYFHRDSVRQWRQLQRKWDQQYDSLENAFTLRRNAIESRKMAAVDTVGSKIYNTIYRPWAVREAKKQMRWLKNNGITISPLLERFVFEHYVNYFLKASQEDEGLARLKTSLPSVELPLSLESKLEEFKFIDGQKYNDILNDQLTGGLSKETILQEVPSELRSARQLGSSESRNALVKEKGHELASTHIDGWQSFSDADQGFSQFKGSASAYNAQLHQLGDSAYLKAEAKRKAEELAMKYIQENPMAFEAIQSKMRLLMKKYSVVPNSADLSTAKKESSLKGESLGKRLVIGGNFQVVTLQPFSVDVSPSIGYKFSRKLMAGIGGNYRQTFGDSVEGVSRDVVGYKGFIAYDILKNFFAYGEFDRNLPGLPRGERLSNWQWRDAAFLGLGRKVVIHPKVEMTAVFVYNFLYEHPDPVYPKRWSFRVGFQRVVR
jgi:hypothetical protein